MDTTGKIVTFILIITSVVAIALTGLREATKAQAAINEEVFNKRAILSSINDYLEKPEGELSDEEVINIFEQKMEQKVLNMNGEVVEGAKAENIDMKQERKKPEVERNLPLYVYDNGEKKYYILQVRGNGLWDEIWGTVALKEDLKTIAGVSFDHAGETPGLGAEIKDNPQFPAQFEGKTIYSEKGKYTAVVVRKGGAVNTEYEVDGISGATVTGDGVSEMLDRGIKYYEPYLEKIKASETNSVKG